MSDTESSLPARGAGVTLTLPESTLNEIVSRAVTALRGELEQASPWMTRKQAAEYLSVPVTRLEKDRVVPFHKWDGRVFYNRQELDTFMLTLGQDG